MSNIGQTRTLYYNATNQNYFDPTCPVPAKVRGIEIPILDLVRIRLAVTAGVARIDGNGFPTSQWQYPLTTEVNAEFTLKQWRNYATSTEMPYDFQSAGFDPTDTPWHNPTLGRVTLAGMVVPFFVNANGSQFTYPPRQAFVGEISLIDNNNNSWTLGAGYLGFIVGVYTTVALGSASSPGGGSYNPLPSGTFSISGSATSFTIAIPYMTTTGQISIGYLPSTGTPTPQIAVADYNTPGQVTVSVPNQPGTGTALNFNWTVVRYS
jgi:hypothetical protein